MKKLLHCNVHQLTICFIVLLYGSVAFAQKETVNWYFGDHIGLNFSSGNPVYTADGALQAVEGNASISDKNGNLLFYTNGQVVYNRNHTLMPNGTGLLGTGTPLQAAIIIQKPGSNGIYYIFTVGGIETNGVSGLNYYEVDMAQDNTLGNVTKFNDGPLTATPAPLITPVAEKLTAVRHNNGKDVWVICHAANNSNNFLSFLVTENGVNTTPVISSVGFAISFDTYALNGSGSIKVSPNGKKLASATPYSGSSFPGAPPRSLKSGLELFDFDTTTGIISNGLELDSTNNHGVEFSANSKVLYATAGSLNADYLYQYDITQPDQATIIASQVNLGRQYGMAALQLAINGKIYAANGTYTNNMHVINNPNVLGTGCDWKPNTVDIDHKYAYRGLPQFIASYFEEKVVYEGICAGSPTTLSISPYSDIQNPAWTFGDPDSGSANTSTELNPVHTFSASGTYNVSVSFTSSTGATYQFTSPVVIEALPVANKPADLVICSDQNSGTFNLSGQAGVILGAQSADDFTVTYHLDESDAQDGTNAITGDLINYSSAAATIYARVQNNASGCYSITEYDLIISALPIVAQVQPLSECADSENSSVSFDLKKQEAALLNGQTGVQVTYYVSREDAESDTDAITTPNDFLNTSNPQVIYVTLTNAQGCKNYTDFEIIVEAKPVIPQLEDLFACDTDVLDGFSSFDLTSQEDVIRAGQADVNVSYFTSEDDAIANQNTITAVENFVNTVSQQPVYVRVVNANGCYSVASFELNVTQSDIMDSNLTLTVCSPLNLNTIADELNEDLDLKLSFYVLESDAKQSLNAIANTDKYLITKDREVLYIRLETNEGCADITTLTLELGDCDIQRGISPNGDKVNDSFELSHLNVRKLTIYNRYGAEVYSRVNYTNEWEGQTNKGDELPTGTYYYMIERNDAESRTGWIYINR